MKHLLLLTAAALLLGACVNPATGYIRQHPELTAAQQKMFMERRIYPGTDVAGLTKAQIRKLMGEEPKRLVQAEGGDAWIYEKDIQRAVTNLAPQLGTAMVSQMGIGVDPSNLGAFRGIAITTIYFKGDVATHADRSYAPKPE